MVAIDKLPDGTFEMVCKVTDFGFATAMDPSGKETLALGTTPYMAPEIVLRKAYDNSVDIWALGVMAYKILTDKFPFEGKISTKQAAYDAIVNNEPNLKPLNRYYQNGSLVKDFMMRCLDKDPNKRWSA